MFSITSTSDGGSTITVYEGGESYTANNDHPNYDIIVQTVIDGGRVAHLFDTAITAYEKFKAISQRVTLSGSTLFFDHDPITGPLAEQIVRFIREGHDFEPLVKFYEKVQSNPNEHSREQLYTWLNRGGFTIDNDGDIVMYKGVKTLSEGVYGSIHAGPAIVNNVAVNGHVPQRIGDVVEMARSKVNHDPSNGCSTGLHASNWDYARGFTTGVVLTVKVNPADVVSVPTECEAQKVRVCRYTVTGVTEYPIEDSLYDYFEDEDEDADWQYEDIEGDYDFDDEDYSVWLDRAGTTNTGEQMKYTVGQRIETTNHAGNIQRLEPHANPKYVSAQLDNGDWVSLPL